jgi:Uma2 family endonuclease
MIEPVRLTYEDLQAFPSDGIRRELVDGELLMSPSPSPRHQRVVRSIVVALYAFAGGHRGEVLFAPVDVVFDDHHVFQPDVLFIAAERLSIVKARYIEGTPSLVVEVLSPSTSYDDHHVKRDAYARFGVPEYWIVDPETQALDQYWAPIDGRYTRSERCTTVVSSTTIPQLTIDLSRL